MNSGRLLKLAMCAFAVLGGAETLWADIQYTFTNIDVPGAASTYAYGINNSGQVVGNYLVHNIDDHGFLYSAGNFTTIDFAGAYITQPYGINDRGEIVGFTADFHAFLAIPCE
jgi:probable HAF family extracellular repeat protein